MRLGRKKSQYTHYKKLEYTTASDDSASLISMILSLMGPGIRPETTVGKHNPPCHLQMTNKALSCKKEAICEHGLEAP